MNNSNGVSEKNEWLKYCLILPTPPFVVYIWNCQSQMILNNDWRFFFAPLVKVDLIVVALHQTIEI
jgi:hypothetical protein